MTQRRYGALTGLAAAAVALGVAELLAVLVGARSAPLVAVGGVVVDTVPARVKDFAVAVFSTHDKLALIIGTTVLVAGLAAAIGVASARRLPVGLAGVTLLGLVGAVAALTRHGASWAYAVPSLVGGACGAGVLTTLRSRLVDALPNPDPDPESESEPESGSEPDPAPAAEPATQRRQFLRVAGGALGAGLLAVGAGRWLADRRGVAVARAAVRLPAAASPAPPLPPEADQRVPGLTPFVTDARDFYRIDTALSVPQVDPTTWRLRIHGRVRRPLTLTYEQLLARPMIERYATLACVSNEVGGDLVGNARWLGVPIRDLLAEAGPLDGADQVVSRSVDGFTAGTPAAVLTDGRDAMLAVGMNGEPLPVEHGFPVRMVVPGLYGYVSATKWLAELELTSFHDFDAYWVRRGWAPRAPVKTESRIDTPRAGASVRRGRVVVAGVAWAQHRGISKVEVRVDDGPWRAATLAAVPSIDTWRQWRWEWDAPAGAHRLWVRATDNGGAVQTADVAPPEPDGATGWHYVDVTVE